MNLLANGASWLAERMESENSQPVTYARGSKSVTINASFAKTEFSVSDQDAILHEINSHDFILRVDQMRFGIQPFEPVAGDRILVEMNDRTRIYEVTEYGHSADGTALIFRWCDPYKKQIRVHTRFVREE